MNLTIPFIADGHIHYTLKSKKDTFQKICVVSIVSKTFQRKNETRSYLDIPLLEKLCTFCKSNQTADKTHSVLEFNALSLQKT